MTQRLRPRFPLAALVLVQFAVTGCGGSKAGAAKGPAGDALSLTLDHEACDVGSSQAEKIDTNSDGAPDIVRVSSGGHEVCRMVDLNHDGKPDSYLYFDGAGALRRRESDFDRDGRLDEVASYVSGTVVRKDRETNLDGRVDTWDFYQGGQLHHRLRDSDADGKVDQWWTWPDPSKLECAVIAADHNGDGNPDPTGIVDVCSLSTPAAPAQGGAGSGDGGAVSASLGPSEAGVTSSLGGARDPDAGASSTFSATTGIR
jgi:hypothetical protein